MKNYIFRNWEVWDWVFFLPAQSTPNSSLKTWSLNVQRGNMCLHSRRDRSCKQPSWCSCACAPGHQLYPRARDTHRTGVLSAAFGMCCTVRSHPVIYELLRERQRCQPELAHIKLANKIIALPWWVGSWLRKSWNCTHFLMCLRDFWDCMYTAGAC